MTIPAEATVNDSLLLAELDHRVANTFQIVGGLLAREASTSLHPEAAVALLKADAQLRAFALLHEALRSRIRAGRTTTAICGCDFVARLCEHLDAACLRSRMLKLCVVTPGTMIMSDETCRALGLIITELVLNAVKHAFAERSHGCIEVALRRNTSVGEIVLSVADDGIGFGVLKAATGRGLGFVDQLARSIGGVLACRTGSSGTCTTVTFQE